VLLSVIVVEKKRGGELVHMWDGSVAAKEDLWWSEQLCLGVTPH
jgi:hypothetical protein